MKKFLFITLLSASLLLGQGISVTSAPVPLGDGDDRYAFGKFSPDGRFALLSHKGYAKIELIEMATSKRSVIISDAPGAGWGMRWNRNSDRFIFKVNYPAGEGAKSVSLYEYVDGTGLTKVADLDPAANNLAFYSFSGNGITTEGADGRPVSIRNSETAGDVNYYISNGKLKIIDPEGKLAPGLPQTIELKEKILFAEWSPSGTRLAVHAAGNGVSVFDLEKGTEQNFPGAEYPSWINDDYLTFMATEDDGYTLINSEIMVAKYDGSESEIITRNFSLPAMWPSAAPDGTLMFTGQDNRIYITKIVFLNN